MANRHVAEKYATAQASWDLDALAALIHHDIRVRYPQSGEQFEGADRYLATIEKHPDLPALEDVTSRSGGLEKAIVTPGLMSPLVTVIGDGDRFVTEFNANYANGEQYHVVSIVRISDGLVIEDTAYFASPFEAPEWRSQYRTS